jgi:HK97 family phage major capsid protein
MREYLDQSFSQRGLGPEDHVNPRIAKLAKQIEDLTAEQEQILVKAEGEGRDLNEEEAKRFDEIKASLVKAKVSLDRENELERNKAFAAAPATRVIVQENNPHAATAGTVTIPAKCRRYGSLQAFKGPKAEENAYVAGLFVAAAFYGHQPSAQRLQELGVPMERAPHMATMSTSSNGGGAYFIPDVMDTTVIELTEQFGVIRRLAEIQPMTADTWKGPRWATSMTAYWVGEGTAPTQSEPGWDQVELVAKNLAAYGKMTVQLNEDALIDLGDKWAMAAAIAFAYAEDDAAFNGTGAISYGGITGLFPKIILAANAASLYTATSRTTLGALIMADFTAVVGRFPNYPGASPAWLCHKEIWASTMLPLQMASGGATPADIRGGSPPLFLGYPVEFVNVAPRASAVTTGVTGILFGDLKLSTKFGDRRQRAMRVGEINDDMIKQQMTLFSAERVDIVNHSLVDPKNSSNPGPVIGLKLG